MDPQILSAIIAGSISLVVSGIVAAWSQRKKLESDYDVALRAERLVEYRKLVRITEPIGWYGKHEITIKSAKKLLAELDHWYFENGGGLLLSDVSYDSFVELLQTLENYDGAPEHLRPAGSKLRSSLAYDIGGRKRPLLKPRVRREELERPEVIAARLSSKK